MPEQKIELFTPKGYRVGYFVNPSITMLPEHNYEISGQFFNHEGQLPNKIEFNPQVLPYYADISAFTNCGHKQLVRVYIQRGRQPVKVTGMCIEVN